MNSQKRLPYPGLRAFTRDEADLFFGRENCVDTMVDRLAATRFLAVLGPSGSGKSSLVRTGLLDALDLGLLAEAGSNWRIADLHPGGQPMRKLAAALLEVKQNARPDTEAIDLLTDELTRGPRSIVEWIADGHLPPESNLLLLVDQFEELFRYGDYAQREEAEAFVETLLESSSSPKVSIYVVITMRSEYLGACASISGLAERISAGLYLAPRMDREECREAIEGPAGVLGFKVEGALVNRLLNDLGSFAPWEAGEESDLAAQLARQADQLPLMQHVLNRLYLRAYREAAGGVVELKLSDYDQVGGLSGALDAHGAEVIAGLGGERLGQIESVFRALVSGNTLATAVRRPSRMGELIEAAAGRKEDVVAIVEAFWAPGCNFLRTSDASLDSDAVIVDISHESLIRQWTPLRQWLEKEARDGAAWRRLISAEERYTQREGGLLTGLDYQSSAAWWEAALPTPAWCLRHGGKFDEVQALLTQSRQLETAQKDAEQERQLRERRHLYSFLGGLAFAFAIAATLSALLVVINGRIKEQHREAVQAKLAADNSRKEADKQRDTATEATVLAKDEANRAKEATGRAEAEANKARAATTHAEAQRNAISNLIFSDQYLGSVGLENLQRDVQKVLNELPKSSLDPGSVPNSVRDEYRLAVRGSSI